MDFEEAIARRRMTRRFAATPIETELVDRLLAAATRAPSAGASQGVDFVVLDTPESRQTFFEMTSDRAWRERTGGSAEGILAAPVVIVPLSDESAYVGRYAAPDKAGSELAGMPASSWPVPYWLVDAAFATMLILLGATNAGLGALFFRLHRPPEQWLDAIGVPAGRLAIGAIAIGRPAPGDEPNRVTVRPRLRTFDERVHRERW